MRSCALEAVIALECCQQHFLVQRDLRGASANLRAPIPGRNCDRTFERNFRWRIEESVENMLSEAFCFSVLPSDPFRAWLRNPIACNNNS